ncbi:cytochrome c oxidase accessory protein CcoG [bacterium]|nr:cytochrome c oxidase accessory protein CcoG [bacterium]
MDRLYSDGDSRLQTTDAHGNRVYVHPEDLDGRWKRRRLVVYWILIGLYMLIPWLHYDGKQLILINLPGREFTFFGNTFWGHDVPNLIFVLLGFVFLIAMITSIWGRVWCGWACPQTVFLDSIFRKVEAFVEGKSRQRQALAAAPWTLGKITKKSIKWILFTVISLHIVHSFLGYFVGARELFWITTRNPSENWTLFVAMLTLTGIVLFDFGWFREQFCIIMCPYGRFQSIIMDGDSLAVAYDEKRGEPRKSIGLPKEEQGDCVNCHQCVKVCPTGIDIRRGLQMECIACTACIDACDNIMEKLHKPPGLIRYTSENALAGKKAPKVRPRTVIYVLLLLVVMGLAYSSVSHMGDIKTIILRGSQDLYKIKSDGLILNHYKVEFSYTGKQEKSVYMYVDLRDENQVKLVTPLTPYHVKTGRKRSTNIFLQFDPKILDQGSYTTTVHFTENPDHKDPFYSKELTLVGPFN